METNPVVSVIVPVYNRDKTIKSSVESILKSEYRNFEILLIDDGSTDGTHEACQKLAACDTRVRFVHKENEGVSVARNIGLSMAQGDWITFVDSDDAILSCHLNVMSQEYSDSIDLIMTGHTSGNMIDGELVVSKDCKECHDVIKAPNAAAYLFNDFKPFKNPVFPIWNKFFRRKILVNNKIKFDSTMSLGEDQVFLCDYLQYAKGLVHYGQKTYVNLAWPNLIHLGSKLRTPSDYLFNQKKNYQALCSIVQYGGAKQSSML